MAKPTAINAVPLVLDRILKAVHENVEEQGVVISTIFNMGMSKTTAYIPFASKFWNTFIFKPVHEELGGHLKHMVIGAAPLSPKTQDSLRVVLNITL